MQLYTILLAGVPELSSTTDIANVLTKHTYFDTAIFSMLKTTTAIAEAFVGMFFLVNLAWNYGSHVFSGKKMLFDIREVVRTLVLMISIPMFAAVMSVIPWLVEISKDAVRSQVTSQAIDNYGKSMMNQYGEFNGMSNQERAAAVNSKGNSYNTDNIQVDPNNANLQTDVNQNLSTEQGQISDQAASGDDTDTGGGMWNMINPFSWGQQLLTGLVYALSAIVKIFMESFIMILMNIMLCLGPLAMAFSVLPFMKEKLGEWFAAYANLAFCSLTLEIIHTLIIQLFFGQSATLATPMTQYASLIMNFTFICCYISVFWLTSKFVGSDSAGRVLSSGMQALQTGAQMVMGGAGVASAAAGAAGGSGGGAAAGAANAGKDVLN